MRVLKLRKAAKVPPPPGQPGNTGDARSKFLAGLQELRSVTTRDEYNKAKEGGVQFSIDGFRKRVRIGNQAMRTTHSELFDELNKVLNFIHSEILGVKKNAKGRSKGPRSADGESEAEIRLQELEALLDRRERDFLDLLEEMRVLRSSA
ncbi:hypothetical protein GFL72_28680 [Rhizobium leguminosarum bv. viciae]|uniref:hypothetical protein n=1 Tax=Rhizobium leguminosarum TaxID=384 RepID=UPI00144157C6|nr:hypothetical protein [Rhizobium leguminosarum]NKK38558.1 hypothetical protein [Rhizobium leguminosarum bv. viciae]